MRIERPIPYIGTRKVRRFALLPITIKNETRWLEVVCVEQTYRPDLKLFGWYNERFVD